MRIGKIAPSKAISILGGSLGRRKSSACGIAGPRIQSQSDIATVQRSVARFSRTPEGGGQAVRSAAPLPDNRALRARRAVRSDNVIDSTKSEMRGAISERKREPLNTP